MTFCNDKAPEALRIASVLSNSEPILCHHNRLHLAQVSVAAKGRGVAEWTFLFYVLNLERSFPQGVTKVTILV